VVIGAQKFCGACAARDDVGELEKLRARHLGKRDVYAWLIGFDALFNLSVGVLRNPTVAVLPVVGLGVVQLAYFAGVRWARLAVIPAVLLSAAAGVFNFGFSSLAGMVIPLILAVRAFFDVHSQLFFREPVSPVALAAAVRRDQNNEAARIGYALGSNSLFLPIAAPVGFVYSIIGLTRVNPAAKPPIGRGTAVMGLAFSIVNPLLWVIVFVAVYNFFRQASD
jgi:hypothetical protein